ncbi:MAG: methyltransferase domain-containing protein [Nitrospiraceae bacterium]|nr:methyltransferase domain-containing protein [Nitrospiraceae bacterium]
MPQTADEVIAAQRQDWNRVASGWDKWDALFQQNLTVINHRLVADARLRPGMRVLDLGSGTGYPALLAGQVVGPSGSVMGLDLAESMLSVATRKAAELGLRHVNFRTGDVSTLPFEDGAFDAVISRFCLMFLPDIPKAAKEIARVLAPGGYLAAAVWASPDKNPSIRIPMDILKTLVTLPAPDPQAPGIFRLAKAGDLRSMLAQAGFAPTTDEEFEADTLYASAEEYMGSLMDIAAPLQNLFKTLTTAQRAEAERGILKAAAGYRRGQTIALPISVRLVGGRKPL